MPKVSIIMPVFNGEKYICESIESIIGQTFADWEFIIVNECGSNQKTTEILHAYEKKDSRIKIIQNVERLRIAESLNVAIRNSSGEYIARMDSDDRAGNMRLQKQVEYLDSHPEIGIVGIHPTVFGDADWDWNTEYNSDTILADSLFYLPFLHPTVMFRKEVVELNRLEYNKEYFYTEDYDFFERMLHVTKASNIDDKTLFFYRIHGAAATFIGGNTGIDIYKQVMARAFSRLELNFDKEELSLLCIHEGCKNCTGEKLYNNISRLDLLLKQILTSNLTKKIYNQESLFNTLHKRWMQLWNNEIVPSYSGNVPQLLREEFERSIFYQKEFVLTFKRDHKNTSTPKVTVLMSVYNGQNYLYESIKSIQNQTFQDWELLIICDPSTDHTVDIITEYQKKDNRIRLVCNEKRLGLAETLNKGIREAAGIYIARMDDDDLSLPTRLEKEVRVLENNPNIAVVGSWQKHFGTSNWVHQPPETCEEMKATLLFECCVCHSTIMFRRDTFIQNHYFYDSKFYSEDYELWTRVIQKYDMYTIPEVLGEYRLNGDNITAEKMDKIDIEARNIVAKTLRNNLHINVKDQDKVLLAKWTNPFQNQSDLKAQKILIEQEKELLDQIRDANKKCKYYDEKALDAILKIRWKWVNGDVEEPREVVDENLNVKKISVLKRFAKRIVRPLYRPFQLRFEKRLIDIQQSVWDLDGHVGDYAHKNLNLSKGILHREDQLVQNIESLTRDTEPLIQSVDDIAYKIDEQLNEFERFGKEISRLNNHATEIEHQLDIKSKEIIAYVDDRIWKAELEICNSLKKYTNEIGKVVSMVKERQKIVLLGTPYHSNLGDYAQTYCIEQMVKDQYAEYDFFSFEVSQQSDFDYSSLLLAIRDKLTEKDTILIQSGMHLTDVYKNEQNLLRQALKVFRENRMIILPQTMFYMNDENKQSFLSYMGEFDNVMFYAREQHTFEEAKKYLKTGNVSMCPDVVHSLIGRFQKYDFERKGILVCKRKDDDDILISTSELKESLENLSMEIHWMDTELEISPSELKMDTAYILNDIVREMSKYQLVITDRLHGTIFSLIANTPVLLIGLKSDKVQANYEWYKNVPDILQYVDLIGNVSEIDEKVEGMLQKQYDYRLSDYFYKKYFDNFLLK